MSIGKFDYSASAVAPGDTAILELKVCECCSRNFYRPKPSSAKDGIKLCDHCQKRK